MTDTPPAGWLRRLRAADPTPDADLLRRFHARADQDAFELLVRRHAPVVLRVCRAVARDPHAAEDAAQAVFLVLARRAGALVGVGSLPAWLARVAYRAATRARARGGRPSAPLEAAAEVRGSAPDPADAAAAADLAAVALAEVDRLPACYHAPVVLCLLDGLTQTEAAARLGWPPGTVAGRLARAKVVLRDRLVHRGVVAPAAAVAALATAGTPAPARFIADVLAAVLGPSGPAAPVQQLAQEVSVAMIPLLSRGPLWAAAGLLAAVTAAAALAAAGPNSQPPTPPAAAPAKAAPPPRGPNRLVVDRAGRLTLIDPDGKNETRLGEELAKAMARDGRLSPDGKQIAFLVVPNPPGNAPGRFFLSEFRLHVRDAGAKGLGTDLGVAKAFAWSPDGAEIAATDFALTEGPPERIDPAATHFVADARTGRKAALNLPANHVISDWSRDGKYLVTTRLRGTKDAPSARLYLMNRDGTEHKAVTGEKGFALGGRLSPDGRRVLYAEAEFPKDEPPTRRLVVSDVATGAVTPVGGVPGGVDVQAYCWSPDGRRVAYTYRRTVNPGTTQAATEAGVVVCDPDGGNAAAVLTDDHPTNVGTLMHIDWR